MNPALKLPKPPPCPFRWFDSSPEVIRLVVMMYVRYPALSPTERLRHLEPLDWRGCCVVSEASLPDDAAVIAFQVESLASRPVLRLRLAQGGGWRLVDLSDGHLVSGLSEREAATVAATFSGTSAGGVLSVTDGTNTARIKLAGDYLGTTFTASSDGHGGTMVTDSAAQRALASPHAFVAAMARLSAPAGVALHAGQAPPSRAATLMAPHVQMA